MHEGGKNEKRENEGVRRKMKGTKAEEENESFRGETKGAHSAKGQHKIMREKTKNEGEKG